MAALRHHAPGPAAVLAAVALLLSLNIVPSLADRRATECEKCCDTGCQGLRGASACNEFAGSRAAGTSCPSSCVCSCSWEYGGSCDSGCSGQRDYETNGECRDWNYRLSNTAEAVGTAIGVTLIIIIVAIVLGVIGCIVCIWFMCCKQTTVIVNQTSAQPGVQGAPMNGVPQAQPMSGQPMYGAPPAKYPGQV